MLDVSNQPNVIHEWLRWQAEFRPEAIAIVADDAASLTFAELALRANALAQELLRLGVQPGDRVVMLAYSSASYAATVFAVLETGAVLVPVNPGTSPEDIAYIIDDCKPVAIAIDRETEPLLESDTPLFRIDQNPSTKRPVGPYKSVNIDDNALALIVYTSGSTSRPRGVACPHAQVCFACTRIREVLGINSDDTVLTGLPMAFDYGLYQIFLAVSGGARLVLLRDYGNPVAIPGLLAFHRATVFPALPSLLAMLLESRLLERTPLSHLRLVTSTGEVFPTAHAERLRRLLPGASITPMYGLTECKRVSILPPQETSTHSDSVGLPLPGTRVAIVDTDGTPVPVGSSGELVVYGPHLAAGYWNDPLSTNLRFRFDPTTGERGLYTGDRFRLDPQGYLYFLGRDGSFIKVGGHRIGTAGLETGLAALSDVSEVCVIGIPDTERGEQVVVFLRSSCATTLVVPLVRQHLSRVLPSTTAHLHITVMSEPLPKTRNGKIDRQALENIASAEVHRGR